MEIRKLVPWNWFRDEEPSGSEYLPAVRPEQHSTPLMELHREIDRIFENAWRGFGFSPLANEPGLKGSATEGMLRPRVDISATDSEYAITVEVPGVDEDDIQLELFENRLIVKGEKRDEVERKDRQLYRVERAYGSFQRVLTLPADAEPDRIGAQFKSGVLTITLPRKAEAKSDGKRIDIRSAA